MLTFFNIHLIHQIKILYEPILTFLLQIEHRVDDGPHALNYENNCETALSVGFTLYVTGSERFTFIMDNYIHVNKKLSTFCLFKF